MGVAAQSVTNGQSRAENLSFDLTSWWRPDIISTCFSNRQNVCISTGLSCLSVLLLIISCFMLVCLRCRVRGRDSGKEAACALYSFFGNLCSTVGAFLSNQLALQVIMGGFMAAVEVINFISIIFPICLCWNTRAEKRLRMMKRRRRQNFMAVSLLLMVGGWSYLTSRTSHGLVDRPLTGRRLLLTDLLHDRTEVLGYILGLLSFVIAWTSKFPALSRARRGERSRAHVSSGLLCSLAGALYTSAILLYDTQYEFVLRAMPWLLASTCCAAMDLAIVVLSWCRKGTTEQQPGRGSPDTESLLGGSSPPTQHNPSGKPPKKHSLDLNGAPLCVLSNKNNLKLADMGHYMDVNIQPVRKVCLKEVTLSREEGVSESHPLRRTVRVVRVDDTFSDSSSLSSDLEWDFEDSNAQWNKLPKEQEKVDEFPLQEWPKNPRPKPTGVCSCGGIIGQAGKRVSSRVGDGEVA
ncbi:transmembrane protein 44 isoform X1 [Coregonus clupeaformis]|uniref:transmembrane protein 44 isoform X1 n=1 Tax=Coregonus clupeaformis TaxID=59861 RepID=UPI001E1C8244|nr:transmembrane protein 44 isoform X1 [Coregonus clupeaformis]